MKCESILDSCFTCGRLGHVASMCTFEPTEVLRVSEGYEPWLRADPLEGKRDLNFPYAGCSSLTNPLQNLPPILPHPKT